MKSRAGPHLRQTFIRALYFAAAVIPASVISCARSSESLAERTSTRPIELTVDRPVVLPLTISDAAREALDNLVEKSLRAPNRLALNVLCEPPTKAGSLRIRVFLNKPEANRESSIDDPHYVTSFSLFPGAGSAPSSPDAYRFSLDLTKTLARLVRNEKPATLAVTFISVPSGGSAADGARVLIKSLSLEAK